MRVCIFGVGALGSHAALFLRNAGAVLRLVDFDRVESRNLQSQAHVRTSVGTYKTASMQGVLTQMWGMQRNLVEARPVRASPENLRELCADCDLLLDCLDNAAGRILLQNHARASTLPLLHAAISADGHVGLVRWDEAFTAEQEGQAGQATCEDGGRMLPEIAVLGALVARAAREFLDKGHRIGYLMSPAGIRQT